MDLPVIGFVLILAFAILYRFMVTKQPKVGTRFTYYETESDSDSAISPAVDGVVIRWVLQESTDYDKLVYRVECKVGTEIKLLMPLHFRRTKDGSWDYHN